MKKCLLFLNLFISLTLTANAENTFQYYPETKIITFLQSSALEKLNFIQKQNIAVYKFETGGAPASDSASENFLTLIPDVDRSRFTRFKDLFDTSVLGVFFSRHNSAYGVSEDTLLLSSEADMWTLAHELSHALIDKHRHRNGVVLEELSFSKLADAKEDYEESMRMYHNLGKFPDDAYALRVFESIKVWTTMQVELLYAFELEEVKIERALGNMYRIDSALGLSKATYDRSAWYIDSNCSTAIQKMNLTKDVLDYFKSLVSQEMKQKNYAAIEEHSVFLSENQNTILSYCRFAP